MEFLMYVLGGLFAAWVVIADPKNPQVKMVHSATLLAGPVALGLAVLFVPHDSLIEPLKTFPRWVAWVALTMPLHYPAIKGAGWAIRRLRSRRHAHREVRG